MGSLIDPYMIVIAVGIVLFMAFIAGIYPALYLSAFQPVKVLKGQLVKGKGVELFRKSLVTIQYAVAMGLIIYTFIVIKQMNQLKTTKLNEQGDQLMAIRFGGIAQQQRFAMFKRSVLEDPQIESVTMANHLPRLDFFGWIGATVKFPEFGDKRGFAMETQLNVEFDFPKTFHLEFITGRDFQIGNLNDSGSMIMNEAAGKAIASTFKQGDGFGSKRYKGDSNRLHRVIGSSERFSVPVHAPAY